MSLPEESTPTTVAVGFLLGVSETENFMADMSKC